MRATDCTREQRVLRPIAGPLGPRPVLTNDSGRPKSNPLGLCSIVRPKRTSEHLG